MLFTDWLLYVVDTKHLKSISIIYHSRVSVSSALEFSAGVLHIPPADECHGPWWCQDYVLPLSNGNPIPNAANEWPSCSYCLEWPFITQFYSKFVWATASQMSCYGLFHFALTAPNSYRAAPARQRIYSLVKNVPQWKLLSTACFYTSFSKKSNWNSPTPLINRVVHILCHAIMIII